MGAPSSVGATAGTLADPHAGAVPTIVMVSSG